VVLLQQVVCVRAHRGCLWLERSLASVRQGSDQAFSAWCCPDGRGSSSCLCSCSSPRLFRSCQPSGAAVLPAAALRERPAPGCVMLWAFSRSG